MTDLRQAAQQALEALVQLDGLDTETECVTIDVGNVIAALRTALEQQAKPVAQVHPNHLKQSADGNPWCREVLLYSGNHEGDLLNGENYRVKLYAAPPQQQAEPDRRPLQAAGTHPAPCARHCEAKAFEIEIRSLKSQLKHWYGVSKQQAEPVAYFDFQERKFSWAKPMKIGPVPVSIKVEPMKLYSESTKREWMGLTDEEILRADPRFGKSESDVNPYQILGSARDLEAKLKERNT